MNDVNDVDKFFDIHSRAIATDSKAIARAAAEELHDDVQRQIRKNFRSRQSAFFKGVKIYEFDEASYVRLSPILSNHTRSTTLAGSPNLWILLPDGARLGFKRISKGFNWDTLRRRYGTRISFAPVGDGHVVLYRDRGSVYPIYKIQNSVQTKQRIEFYEKAEEIANRYGMTTVNDPEKSKGRGIGFE